MTSFETKEHLRMKPNW